MKTILKILLNEGGWIGAAIGAGASLLGGLSSAQAQRDANKTNQKIAQKQMDWQERMSSTAHQRQVADMKAAGLNPMLSAMQSGASTGSAQMIEAKPANDLAGLENAVSSAIESRRLKKEIDAVQSTIELNNSQKETQRTQQELNSAQTTKQTIEAAALGAQLPAIENRSKAEAERAKYDLQFSKQDAFMQRAQRVIDGASSAVDIINPLKGLFRGKSKPKSYRDENYNSQGEHTGSRERKYLD